MGVLLSSSLFMVDIRLRYLISRGTPMILGQFVQYQKTILCKFGKWQRIFTTTRKLIHLHLKPIRNVQISKQCIMYTIVGNLRESKDMGYNQISSIKYFFPKKKKKKKKKKS